MRLCTLPTGVRTNRNTPSTPTSIRWWLTSVILTRSPPRWSGTRCGGCGRCRWRHPAPTRRAHTASRCGRRTGCPDHDAQTTGISRGLNTSLSPSTITASGCQGLASPASPGQPPLAALPVGDLRRILAEHHPVEAFVACTDVAAHPALRAFQTASVSAGFVEPNRPNAPGGAGPWNAGNASLPDRPAPDVATPGPSQAAPTRSGRRPASERVPNLTSQCPAALSHPLVFSGGATRRGSDARCRLCP